MPLKFMWGGLIEAKFGLMFRGVAIVIYSLRNL